MSSDPVESAHDRLAGLKVLVTRPRDQAARFCALIRSAGGTAIGFPTIEIVPMRDNPQLLDLAAHLDRFDLVIFISANAVRLAMPLLIHRNHWPPGTRIAAVGEKTAAALEPFGVRTPLAPPSPFNSEALLALPDLVESHGRRIVIVRGGEGRDLLEATLRARGAEVVAIDVYRRVCPAGIEPATVRRITDEGIDLIAVTSGEGLRNLVAMSNAGMLDTLLGAQLVLGTRRLSETARALGFRIPPVFAANPSDESMFESLIDWARNKRIQT